MDRRALILAAAERNGRVSVEALAAEFGVSPHTIRRDINALCDAAKLRRLHGGAAFVDGGANIPYDARAGLNLEAKRLIARCVADLIPDGATLFLSVGTTPALIAAALSRREALTVVTNNLNAAMALAENPANRILLPGGEMRLPDRDLLGEGAIALFDAYRADFGIYGAAGIDRDGALLDFSADEVRAREAIRANSRCAVFVADCSKFGRTAPAVGGALRDAQVVAIDRRPEDGYASLLQGLAGEVLGATEREAAGWRPSWNCATLPGYGTAPAAWRTSRYRSSRGGSSRSSARRAAESRRSCACSPGSTDPNRAPSGSRGATSPTCPLRSAGCRWCSSPTPFFPISTCARTWSSA
jgi:DeoR family glycerol-3-phosphate regulon repressor